MRGGAVFLPRVVRVSASVGRGVRGVYRYLDLGLGCGRDDFFFLAAYD